MNLKRLLYAFLLPMLIALQVAAQEKVVSGKVTDARDGTPVVNASVVVKGGAGGTQTGADGTFRLSVPAAQTPWLYLLLALARQKLQLVAAL
jgi:iron complex outermembrane receptor protein